MQEVPQRSTHVDEFTEFVKRGAYRLRHTTQLLKLPHCQCEQLLQLGAILESLPNASICHRILWKRHFKRV